MEQHEDQLSLRDLVTLLRRKQRWIWLFTLFSILAGTIYAFIIAKPIYESMAVLSVNPLKVKAQLENKIQLQQRGLLTFEGLKALALSQETLRKTLRHLKTVGAWPSEWDQMTEDELLIEIEKNFKILNKTGTVEASNTNEPPALISAMAVKANSPDIAAELANAWAEATAQIVNDMPTKQLEANLRALAEQITPAETAYRRAQTDWEAFQKQTKLAEWKKELGQRINEKVSIQTKIEAIERSIHEKEARMRELEKQMARERKVFSGKISPTQLAFMDRDLDQAKAFIATQYKVAHQDYNEAAKKLVAYKSKTPIERWKSELAKFRARVAAIELRLRELATERAKLTNKLRTVEVQLGQTPKTLVLKREVTADPILGLTAAKDLEVLRNLKLENEILYSIYTGLVKSKNDLIVELNALDEEEKALVKERDRLQPTINELRARISKAAANLEKLGIEVNIAKSRYQGWRKLYEEYKNISGNLTFESPNPRYQKLRSEKLALQIDLSELRTRLTELKNQLAYDEKHIQELKEKVAAAELKADRLQENLRLTKETYLALKQKQTDLKIELASLQNNLAQVLSPAYPIPEPVAPKKLLILVLSGFLGLMVGVFAAFLSAALEPPPNPQSA